MYALVLLLGMSGAYTSGATVTTIHGFRNIADCNAAGEKIAAYAMNLQPGFICVKVLDKPAVPKES